MNPTIVVKPFIGRSDELRPQIEKYLSSNDLTPSQIKSMLVIPHPVVMPGTPSGMSVILRHLSVPAETTTDRCKVIIIVENNSLGDLAGRMELAVNQLGEILVEQVMSLGIAYAWIAISRKVL